MQHNSSKNRGIAWLGIALFVGGLVLPFALYAALFTLTEMNKERAVILSIGCCIALECLAFALGAISRRYTPGKIAAAGGGVIVVLALGIVVLNSVS